MRACYQACYGVDTQVADITSDEADDEAGHNGDDETVDYPHVTAVGNGLYETVASSETYGGHEEADAHLADHEVGGLGGVGGETQVGTNGGDDARDNQRRATPACSSA